MLNRIKKKFFLAIIVFLFLYAPPIVKDVNFAYFISLYSIVNLLCRYRKCIFKILNNTYLKRFNFLIIYISCYVTVLYVFSCLLKKDLGFRQYLLVIYRFFYTLFLIEPVTIYLILFLKSKKLGVIDFLDILFWACTLEGIFTILSIISPDAKALFAEIILTNTDYYKNVTQQWQIDQNFFGLAASMTDYFGFVTGVISSTCVYSALCINKKYYWYMPLFILMMVLNSTTGVVLLALSIMLFYITGRRIKKNQLAILLIMPIVMLLCIPFLDHIAHQGLMKIWNNFWEIFDRSRVIGSTTSIRNMFMQSFWILPDSLIELIFGTGHSVYATGTYAHSDIGYINDIWTFGILGSFILYISYMSLSKIVKINNDFYRKILIMLYASFLVFNIKGIAFGANPGNGIIIFIILVVGFLDIDKRQQNKTII